MFTRYIGLLLACGTVVLLGGTWVDAQTQPKKDGPLLAPKGFDKARTGIDKGKLETLEYESKTVGAKRKLVVYTFPGYKQGGNNLLPIFYLLHGKGGNETSWSKGGGAANTILDNLYADKKLVPMIVVMPNGTMDAAAGGKKADFENELLKDIMPFVEGRYPIQKDPEHRAIAGLSMGGGQALRAGLRNIDKFAYIGGYSSALFGAQNLVSNPADANKKIKLLYVGCGDSPKETLFDANKGFHNTLEKSKVNHIWNVFPEGQHNYQVWKNDLYVFSQMLFKDKK
ncbi:MAG TPA: alpha/beta hydrolase-fold protein [Gemmataceae bacterium]|nr:alpha/beta hydrolase-fold protein [Gemmataceae bacterium]